MSFCRLSETSDLYLYLGHDDGLMHCDGCLLSDQPVRYTTLPTVTATIAHVREHKAAGHRVPLDLLATLHATASATDAEMARIRAQRARQEPAAT